MCRRSFHARFSSSKRVMKTLSGDIKPSWSPLLVYGTLNLWNGPWNESCSTQARASKSKTAAEPQILVQEMNSSDLHDKTTKRIGIEFYINLTNNKRFTARLRLASKVWKSEKHIIQKRHSSWLRHSHYTVNINGRCLKLVGIALRAL